jgi:archaeal flagellin FlaB
MFKFINGFKKFNRSQKGITGLETAIILIAFVTVASVLAYSVLSAGIFSSEKGKAAVYSGLAQAQSSMQIRGSVVANSTTPPAVDTITFSLASVLGDESVDMTDTADGNNNVVINYMDQDISVQNVGWTKELLGTERGGEDMLDPGETMMVTVTVPEGAVLLTDGAYATFTLQVIPPKGAAITIQRTLPASVLDVNDLH